MKEKILKNITVVAIIISMFIPYIFGIANTSIAVENESWKTILKRYMAVHMSQTPDTIMPENTITNFREVIKSFPTIAYEIDGAITQKWVFKDIRENSQYQNLNCVRSGARIDNTYIKHDLYHLKEDEPEIYKELFQGDNLTEAEADRNYQHTMWEIENFYLFNDADTAEDKQRKLNEFNEFIEASSTPYNNNETSEIHLYNLGDGLYEKVINLTKNEVLIKGLESEILLGYIIQTYPRTSNTSTIYNVIWNGMNGYYIADTASAEVQEYARLLVNKFTTRDNSNNYNIENINKYFNYSPEQAKVSLRSTNNADTVNNLSGSFFIKNKFKSNITGMDVYLNGTKITNYKVFNSANQNITENYLNQFTQSASNSEFEFRIQCEGLNSGDSTIRVELNVDYGDIISATLLEPQDKTLDQETSKGCQYLININKDHRTEVVSSETESTAKQFDLALTKQIIEVKGTDDEEPDLYDRLHYIDVEGLNNKNSNNARYLMNKSALYVEPGKNVVYSIKVYNEGEIDGYAKEIKDYLPAGLEMVDPNNSTINSTYGWEYDGDNRRIVKTSYLANQKIDAFVKGASKPSSKEVKLECYINENLTNKTVLDNIAEISSYGYYADLNGTGTPQFVEANANNVDRDSKQNTVVNDAGKTITEFINSLEQIIENKVLNTPGYNQYRDNKNIISYQDDDDIDRICVSVDERVMDLALRKWISKVDDTELEGETSREPKQLTNYENYQLLEIAQSLINAKLINGRTTLEYDNPKQAITLKPGAIVTYKIAIFNEGSADAYAEEVTDYLPQGLEFIDSNEVSEYGASLNRANGWTATKDANGITKVKTTILSKENGNNIVGNDVITNSNIIVTPLKAFTRGIVTYQKDVQAYRILEIACKVSENVENNKYLTNRAEITSYAYESKDGTTLIYANEDGIDRDSKQNTIKDSLDLDNWYERKYIQRQNIDDPAYIFDGEEDDDDFETVLTEVEPTKEFDLSLRKFITAVNDKKLEGEESREPKVELDTLINGDPTKNGEKTATYIHRKDPVYVNPKDIVEYTLRVYNEGELDGYASRIIDDVPVGVQMVAPQYDNEGKPLNLNAEYGWIMYKEMTEEDIEKFNKGEITIDSEINQLPIEKLVIRYNKKFYIATNKPEEAVIISSDYLSMQNGEARMTRQDIENPNLISAFNGTDLVYRDIKVQFEVKTAKNEKAIITNYAQISEHEGKDGEPAEDRDSHPNEWIPGEDDQDVEHLHVNWFDLALYKWVSSTIVIEDGQTKEYVSGHTQDDKNAIVNVTIAKDKLNKTVVKFKWTIKVENQSPIPGYATEIKDHIPEGLKFIEADNTDYGWKQAEDGTITTDYLKGTLLQKGETAEVVVVLTWINNENNLGAKVNYAEISADYNDYGAPDIDSTPNNFTGKVVEDDEDVDEVRLNIRTGNANITSYVVISIGFLTIVLLGAILVKINVLDKEF